jgi:hypothetical protein
MLACNHFSVSTFKFHQYFFRTKEYYHAITLLFLLSNFTLENCLKNFSWVSRSHLVSKYVNAQQADFSIRCRWSRDRRSWASIDHAFVSSSGLPFLTFQRKKIRSDEIRSFSYRPSANTVRLPRRPPTPTAATGGQNRQPTMPRLL